MNVLIKKAYIMHCKGYDLTDVYAQGIVIQKLVGVKTILFQDLINKYNEHREMFDEMNKLKQ